MITTIKGSQN